MNALNGNRFQFVWASDMAAKGLYIFSGGRTVRRAHNSLIALQAYIDCMYFVWCSNVISRLVFMKE